jgi:hypothetical protein
VLALAILGAAPAASVDQIGWPTYWAAKQLVKKYTSEGIGDATCTPVGQVAKNAGVSYYGEFACAMGMGDGSQTLIAIRPLTRTTFAVLDATKPRPAGTFAMPPYPGGTTQQIVGTLAARRVISLVDDSTWQLTDPRHELAGWKLGDQVVVQPGSFYTVVDRTRGQALTGKFLGFSLIDPGIN